MEISTIFTFVACFAWCWSHIYTSCDVSIVPFTDWFKIECFQISEDSTELDDISYQPRSNTDRVIIMNSSISTLPANFSNNLSHVRLLFLEDNNIKTIQTGAFDNFNFLRYLDLSNNPIEVIGNVNLFSDMKELEILSLNNTLIERFAYDFTKGNLKTLNLSCSQVQTVDFSKLPTVEIVDLSYNFIQNWTNSVFKTKMQNLNLSSNSLSSFFQNHKEPFRGMYELRELYLKNISLNSIPIDFFRNVSNLITLDLSSNQISQFQIGTFSKLVNLENLYVQHNQLTSLFELSPLIGLVSLYIDYNEIDLNLELESIKYHFEKLRQISFSHNSHDWSCRELITVYHELKKSGVRVMDGDSSGVENLHGIPCSHGEPTAVSKNEEQPGMNQFCKNVEVLNNEGEAEKLKFSTLKAENNAISGVFVIYLILLFTLVFFVGCMTYMVYKMFVKYIVRDSRERILMQENLI